jgi:hypothetical protein
LTVDRPQPLTDAELEEIEALAKTNAAETYRGALLALVAEVRRLRGVLLEGRGDELQER